MEIPQVQGVVVDVPVKGNDKPQHFTVVAENRRVFTGAVRGTLLA